MRFVVTIVLAAALGAPASALGADVHVVASTDAAAGYELRFDASPGEVNDVVIAPSAGESVTVTDAGAPLSPGPGCRAQAAGAVCAAPDSTPLTAHVSLGDQDDHVLSQIDAVVDGGLGADVLEAGEDAHVTVTYANRTAGVSVTLDGQADDGQPGEHDRVAPTISAVVGGAGDDVLSATGATPPAGERGVSLSGGPGADQLVGSPGDDQLSGGDGADVLAGGRGADDLDGGAGPDVLRGGDGVDHVTYERRTAAVHVTLDGAPGDGEAGEGDNVGRDVEHVTGGAGNDVLVGNGNPNELTGGPGNDRLEGGDGVDLLEGGPGADTIDPGPGRDRVFADAADRLLLLDGERDRTSCDALLRRPVQRDAEDRFTGCAPLPGVVRTTLRARHDGGVAVPLRCPRASLPCEGVLALLTPRGRDGRGGKPIGRAHFHVAGGQTASVVVRLRGRARAALLTGRAVSADVRVTVGAIETAAKRPLRVLPP